MKGTVEVFTTRSPRETEAVGEELSGRLSPGDRVGLVGELGSGKTCLVRGLARGLGEQGYVKSPSFTIINIYEGGRLPLYHIDLYRLGKPSEAFEAGIEDYIYGNGVSVIEWADRVPELLDACNVVVKFRYLGETEREVRIERVQ